MRSPTALPDTTDLVLSRPPVFAIGCEAGVTDGVVEPPGVFDGPRLPFDGSVPVQHRGRRPQAELGDLGSRLARCWACGGVFAEPLLSGPGVLLVAAAMTACALVEVVALVGSHLAALHDLREQAIARLVTEIGRFVTFLEASGVIRLEDVTEQHCDDFIRQAVFTRAGRWAKPSVSTMYLRRTAIRLLYGTARQLHLTRGDPTLDIVLPPRSALSTRPLADDEEALCRIWAQPTLDATRHGAAWSLGQATATGTEQAAATVADLDLGHGRVWLHGNETKREPRWGLFTEWGLIQIERRLAIIGTDPATRLVSAATRSRNARQASTCTAVREVLVHAGLAGEVALRPASLPAWAGAQVLARTGRIDEVAHALGIRSLDRAALTIGWNW